SGERVIGLHQRLPWAAHRRLHGSGQRRRVATQWRGVRDRRNIDHEPGAGHRPLDALMAAAAPPPASTDGAAVRTLELTKHYGASVALSGLTMVVPRGEVFGFLGPNGSGKTTAGKLLLGISRPTGGEAWVLGRPAGDRQTRGRVGYLPELFRYQGWLSAAEVLGLHCRLAGIARAEWPAQISGALSTVGLAGHADAKVETFSKGMQQRLRPGGGVLRHPQPAILPHAT